MDALASIPYDTLTTLLDLDRRAPVVYLNGEGGMDRECIYCGYAWETHEAAEISQPDGIPELENHDTECPVPAIQAASMLPLR